MSRDFSIKFALSDCLFGAMKLAKNADPDKYRYNGYDIGFDARSKLLLPSGERGKKHCYFWFRQ